LSHTKPREARRIRARIRRGVRRRDVKYIIDFIRQHGGDKYAEDVMKREAIEAVAAVRKLPDLPVRSILIELVDFAITRRR